MVNKAAVILLGGIVLVAVVVIGGVTALVLDGGDASTGTATAVKATPLPENVVSTATVTPARTATTTATNTPTATPATSTPTDVPGTTVLPRRFDEREIEVLIAKYINQRRRGNGLQSLDQNGTTVGRVTEMARNHSVAMADEGEVSHSINGETSTNRYKDSDLYRTCQWESGTKTAIVKPDNNGYQADKNALETVGRTIAGREYDKGDQTQFNGNESAVAQAIVEEWWSDKTYRTRLTLENAGSIGVGVDITRTGEVYATANLCK